MKTKQETKKKDKIKQSETVIVNRSQINFAPYNPRKKNKEVVDKLKANFKKVGFLGGIQWNDITGNIIGGHKRLEALDLIYGYDGTKEKDYSVKVEKISLDEKTEKEQNIFLNNKRVQGEMDLEILSTFINDIDISNAGLEEYDIKLIEAQVPNFNFSSNEEIKKDNAIIEKSNKEKKEHVKNIKKQIKSNISESHQNFYFCVTFDNYMDKAEFLESIGINGDITFVTSKQFIEKINEK